MTELRDRDLVRLYWPVELRSAFDALFAIDDAMADVVAKATDPTLAAIKLAWWRERLEGLDAGQVPAEPRLKAAASDLLPKGVSGTELAHLEGGWAALLQPDPDPSAVAERGVQLFALAASLLGIPEVDGRLGAKFAIADVARRHLLKHPPPVAIPRMRLGRAVRPITGLAVLALRPLSEPEATPGRAFALLRHRLTGRIG